MLCLAKVFFFQPGMEFAEGVGMDEGRWGDVRRVLKVNFGRIPDIMWKTAEFLGTENISIGSMKCVVKTLKAEGLEFLEPGDQEHVRFLSSCRSFGGGSSESAAAGK